MGIWSDKNKPLNFLGLWDADSNTPELASSGVGGNKNDFYIVGTAGTTSIDSINSWNIGDWIINNGLVWEKIDNSSNIWGTISGSIANQTDLSDLLTAKALDSAVVHNTENETIAGIKKFGDASNNTHFEADGTMVAEGNAKVWDDIILTASNLRPGQTPPTLDVFLGGIYGFRFTNGDEMYGAFELPHDYCEGTDLFVHVHWSPTTTNTGDIVWHFESSVEGIGDVFNTPSDIAMTPAPAPGIINKHVLSNIVTISGTGRKIGDIIAFRLYRQASGGADTFTGNAFLHSIGIHYEKDTLGSRQITTK